MTDKDSLTLKSSGSHVGDLISC